MVYVSQDFNGDQPKRVPNPAMDGKAPSPMNGDNSSPSDPSADATDQHLLQARALWQDIQPQLRGLFTQPEFDTWITHIRVSAACEKMVTLRGGSSFAASRIRTQFLTRLQDRWTAVDSLGRTLVVDLTRQKITSAPSTAADAAAPQAIEPIANAASSVSFHPHKAFQAPAGLVDFEAASPAGVAFHRLDNFEIGTSNELGYALARRVCHAPTGGDVTYLHGQHGTGKTHLVEAIRHELSQTQPQLRVVLVPGQNFLAAFQSLLRDGKAAQFTAAVCSADVLLVDDINLICGKRATEDELEQCIRRLTRAGRKVVLTGDVPCDALQVMSAGLMSLLKSSYHAALDLPDFDLRRKIAAREVSDLAINAPGFALDDRCLDMIAARIVGSGRIVKGAVRQVYLRSFLLGKEADMNAVLHTISEKSAIAPRTLSVERIKRGVCAYFDLSLDDLISPTRRRSVARPRQIAMYLCRKHTGRSLPDIGRRFGNRDHATVIHAVKTIEELILRDASIASDVDAIVARLASGQVGG